MALTDIVIKSAKPKDKDYKLGDSDGLYLFITKAGGKLWRFKYRVDGKEKKLSLGSYPEVSLLQARVKRDQARKLHAQGIDPSLEKKHEKLKKLINADLSFQKVATDWMDIKAKILAPSTHKKIQQTFNANVFPRLGKLPIGDIIYEQIRQVIQIMQKRGAIEYSMKTREWIANIFEFAVMDGLIENSPIKGVDARLEKPVNQRHPYLKSMDDAGKFLRGVSQYGGTFEAQSFAYIILHVAQRPSELRMAKWTEFNLLSKAWTLPIERSKTRAHMGTAHTIMLSDQVLAALQELHKYTGHNEYLFSSTRFNSNTPISEATARKVFRECFADYHIVPHGCRHFFSTQANAACKLNRLLNFDADVIEAALGHKDPNEIRGTYNVSTYEDSRIELSQWWSDQLDVAQSGNKIILKEAFI